MQYISGNATMIRMVRVLMGIFMISVALPVAQAVSKDAQELIALRQKRAPLECELTRLYREVGVADKAGDKAKVKALTQQMHAVDDKLSVDSARVEQLTKRVRNTSDHKAILEQQIKLDKACK
jgi:hypothetical protein